MIRPLTINDIPQLAPIHMHNASEWSHNAQLGEEHIANIYRVILEGQESFGYGYFQEDTVVSFITATTDYFQTMKRLYKLVTWKHYGALMKQVFRSPGELMDMWEAKFVIPKLLKQWDIQSFLLTWHNNFAHKDTSIAAIYCMQKTLSELKHRGFDVCTVQVDANNVKPNTYYQSIKAPLKFSSKHNNIYQVST